MFVLVILVPLVLGAAAPALAQTDMQCPNMQATIKDLRACVQHAIDMGYITNPLFAQSLLAKIDAAQAAYDRGQTSVAILDLQAFILQVQAQSGKLIDSTHAEHMIMHAQMVIAALQSGSGG